jgi:PD-(D/E)XK nuclease superfamily
MAFLYRNVKGNPHSNHSYSAGLTFEQCPRKYFLQKVLGWKERPTKAYFALGTAFETAVQFFHENNGIGAEEVFRKEWAPHALNPELTYTKVERNWENCLQIGYEWLKLYKIIQPSLPIPLGGQTLWQKEASREVFPGDPNYGGINDKGRLDIIAYVDPNHPMLPKLEWKAEYGPLRPLIVDIKTAAQDFPEAYGIAAYDIQLRRYSWQSGIRDVAILCFVKKGRKLQKGYSVTLLEDAALWKAGQEAVIAAVDEDDLILVANDFMIDEMEKAQGRKADKNGAIKPDQTKDGKARRDAWLATNGVCVPSSIVTKQRVQFNAGYVSIESADEAGEIAESQIVRIVNEYAKYEKTQGRKGFPSTFKIRGMNNDLKDPYFRAFILGDDAFRDSNFIKSDDESIDEMFAEDSEINEEND